MSLFGALNTAISGLSAQADSFSNLSNNVANSQTVGYKEVQTSFLDFLTSTGPNDNASGSVSARSTYLNNLQGTITSSSAPLALAINGQGFFSVSSVNGSANGRPTFDAEQYYTRAGDFALDADGYIVNQAGYYLNGWTIDSSGTANQNALAPIRVSETVYSPVPTGHVSLSANLPPAGNPDPANSGEQDPIASTIDVYDAQGNSHQLTLSFTLTDATNRTWSLDVTDGSSGSTIGTPSTVVFAPDGKLSAVNGTSTTGTRGTVTLPANTSSSPSWLTQDMTLDLGAIGGTDGVTQYAGSSYLLRSINQDGCAPGSFSSVSATSTGEVVVNYDNGQSRMVAQVPIITFGDPNALQQLGSSTFAATQDSGSAIANAVGLNGAGSLDTKSIEQSNVDLASEFTKLIVAQRAYSANAKVVTTADDMLSNTLDMKR